jgi:hypothetical protein
MGMVVDQIKCVACKQTINSFYAVIGKCPACGASLSAGMQYPDNSDLKSLKRQKKVFLENTLSKGQVKRMFDLSEDELSEIPVIDEFGKSRYSKSVVANFVREKLRN